MENIQQIYAIVLTKVSTLIELSFIRFNEIFPELIELQNQTIRAANYINNAPVLLSAVFRLEDDLENVTGRLMDQLNDNELNAPELF